MENTRQVPQELLEKQVVDSEGNKVGTITNVWVDATSGVPKWIGVKVSLLSPKSHVVPLQDSRVSESQVQVPYEEKCIKDAPSFDGDAQLIAEQEDMLSTHYGLDRTTNTTQANP